MLSSRFPYPQNKKAAVVFSIDDCHPATSSDGYEAGGDLEKGALGRLRSLLEKHSKLQCTLFLTADWRETSVKPTNKILSKIPWLKNHLVLAARWPKGKMRLDRHPQFLEYLKNIPRTEWASHGLDHVGKGLEVVREFLRLNQKECHDRLLEIEKIFHLAGLGKPQGFAPPGWALTETLLKELERQDYAYLCSARDLKTDFHLEAVAAHSGIQGVPLYVPGYLNGSSIVHIAANWSVNSDLERADKIIQGGGVLSVKAHITKYFFGHTSMDGLDADYTAYLSQLFRHLENSYGDDLWWTSMANLAAWYRSSHSQVIEAVQTV